MSNANRRAAAQMSRDGISKLPRWTKGRHIGCATVQFPLPRRNCGEAGCGKRAGYSTPDGDRCAEHAFKALQGRVKG